MRKSIDIKGFEHDGCAWSWPEIDDEGRIARSAHAHAEVDGRTACGAPWPHRYVLDEKRRRYEMLATPVTTSDGTVIPTRIASRGPVYERLRNANTRRAMLCPRCVEALEAAG